MPAAGDTGPVHTSQTREMNIYLYLLSYLYCGVRALPASPATNTSTSTDRWVRGLADITLLTDRAHVTSFECSIRPKV